MQVGEIQIRTFRESILPERDEQGRLQLRGEVPWLIEGPEHQLDEVSEAIGVRRLSRTLLQLEFGNSVGKLTLPVLGAINVVTAKWTERDFNRMLMELSEIAGGLPYAAGSLTSLPYDRSVTVREDVLYHAFTYLRHILTTEDPSEQLMPSLRSILSDPHRRIEKYQRSVPIALVRRVTAKTLDSVLGSTGNLCSVGPDVCERVPLARTLNSSLPESVDEMQIRMSFDTPENRFIKSFLSFGAGIADEMQNHLQGQQSAFARRGL